MTHAPLLSPPLPSAKQLPPTARDLEIHRLNLVEQVSTYAIAEKFAISQTRVRQIVHRVGRWLANMLPVMSEEQQAREAKLAQHLAADQLKHQIEQLQMLWEKSHEPKFLRQQTRAILSLARLGVSPGTIDALAADVTDEEERATEEAHSTQNVPATHSPVGDCSVIRETTPEPPKPQTASRAIKPAAAKPSEGNPVSTNDDLLGFEIMEQHLLTLLRTTSPHETAKRHGIEAALTELRREHHSTMSNTPPSPATENKTCHAA